MSAISISRFNDHYRLIVIHYGAEIHLRLEQADLETVLAWEGIDTPPGMYPITPAVRVGDFEISVNDENRVEILTFHKPNGVYFPFSRALTAELFTEARKALEEVAS